MKEYLAIIFACIMSFLIVLSIREYQETIKLYQIIERQNAALLAYEKEPKSIKETDYNRLKIGIMRGDQFPIVHHGWYKCARVITE